MDMNKMAEITSDACLSCGACCFSPYEQKWFADLEPRECKGFTQKQIAHNAIKTVKREMQDGILKGIPLHVCCCLEGSVMHRVSCSIYEKRPKACQKFEPGSFGCRLLRMGLAAYSDIETTTP
jgi:Fe-S-cluster containining protein